MIHSRSPAGIFAHNINLIITFIQYPLIHIKAADTLADAVLIILGYLEAAGPEILASVGAYQIEGIGARLFECIDGDYFAVLGLALFPLLAFLREQSAVDF